jgi:hypothetical protein
MATRSRTNTSAGAKRAAGMTTPNPKKAGGGGGKKEASAAAADAAGAGHAGLFPMPPPPAKPHSRLAFAFYQYGGLAFCVTGVALLWAGYGAGWMDDTRLTMLCVALNCVGLFLHETRPFSLQREVEAERDAQEAAAKRR